MGIGLGFKGLRAAAAALFVLAQLTLGFAHQPVALPSSEAPIDLAAYALPDGSLPDLCLNSGDAGPVLKAHPCDACVLTSAPGLAVAPQPALAAPDGRRIVHLAARCERRPADEARGAQARGPPVT
jgi:hypothetical protein